MRPPPVAKKRDIEVESEPLDLELIDGPEEEQVEEEETDSEIAEMRGSIKKLLKHSTFEPKVRYWLDTGSELMNAALGSPKRGLPYGKIYEFRGPEHGGKTTIATVLAGLAQADGAAVGYIDLEDSRDPVWAKRLGLNWDKVYPIYPKLTLPRKKKEKKGKKEEDEPKQKRVQLQSAEQLFQEAETAMEYFREKGYEKQVWVLDSVANIQTEMAVESGLDYNMRVNLDRAAFLSRTLPKWCGLAANYNAMILLLNQLRTTPGVVFGNPEYSPGGRALRHNVSIRANVKRAKGGTLKHNGRVVGIASVVQNFKNKAGEGSNQDEVAIIKVKWKSNPAVISYMSMSEMED
jgi:RecA/RadA recombinase